MESRVDRKGLFVLLLFCLFVAWALSLPCLSEAADTEAPTGSITINGGATYTKSTSVTLTLSATDNVAVTKMRFSNDGATWGTAATYAATKTYSLSTGNGPKTVYVQFSDAAGNWSETASDSITLDATAPATIASPLAGSYPAAQNVTLTATDNLSGLDKIYYTIDGTTPGTSSPVCTGPITISVTTTLMYRATDLAGNMESAKTQKYTIDTVAPAGTMIINGGAEYTKSTSVTLTLSATDDIAVTKVRFSNDGATWGTASTYAATKTYSLPTGNGPKTVYAQFADAAGNWSETATDSITLDATVPVTTASPVGGNYFAAQNVTLTATDNLSGVDKVYYTTDGTTPTTGSPVYTGPIAISATTTLMYRAADLAGNLETAKTQKYTIDTIAPAGTMIINGGAEYTKSTSVTLTLSATDNIAVTKVRFSNDGVTWGTAATYAATKTYSVPSGNGPKTVYAQFADAAGNWSETASDSITLDATAPVTTASPVGGNYSAAQAVTLTPTDNLSGPDKVYYTTDGTTPTTTSSVYTGPITISATTTLMYRATDLAGNLETAKTQKYTIDTIAPAGTMLINGGAEYAKSTSVTLTLSATDNIAVTKVRFSNDGVTWGTALTYAATKTYSLPSGNGPKTVYAQFADAAGNWSETATDSITLDATVPVTTASPVGGNYFAAQNVTLTATDNLSGVDKVYYTTDGTTPTTGSPVYTGPIAISATTTLMYRAADLAGNLETAKTQKYTIDTVAPAGTMIINGGAEYTKSTSVTLTLSATDNIAVTKVRFSNDGVTWGTAATYAATKTYSVPSGNGPKTVYAQFADAAGNWSETASDSITLDATAPVTTASPVGGNYSAAQAVTLTPTDNLSGPDKVYYTTDGTTPTTTSSVYTGPIAISATTTLMYRATDLAGNLEGAKTQKYTIDSTAPGGTIVINGGAEYAKSTSVTLTLSATDEVGVTKVRFGNDGSTWGTAATYAATKTYSLPTGNGPKTVYAQFADAAGNWSETASDSITLDATAPVTTASPVGGNYFAAQNVTLTATDNLSGVDKVYYTTDGTTPTTGSTVYAGPITISATTTLMYRATDLAGNLEAAKTQKYTIDDVAPAGTIVINGGAEYTKSTSVTLTLSASDEIGVTKVRFSNDGTTWGTPATYAATKTYSVPSGNGPRTVYAQFSDAAGNWSETASDSITLDATAPVTTASPVGGNYSTAQTVTLTPTDNLSGPDKIYYTTDGTSPTTTSSVYSGPISISATTTLMYRATDLAGNLEGAKTQKYTIVIQDSTPPVTTASLVGGTYFAAQTVTLAATDDVSGVDKIYYTTDGTTPGTASLVYTEPITILTTATLMYRAVDFAGNMEEVKSQTYTISVDNTPPVTTATPPGGTYALAQTVTLAAADDLSGVNKIYYTTDGTTPTAASPVHTGPISISATTTLMYRAVDLAGNMEEVKSQTYTIVVDSTPPVTTASPPGGNYNAAQTVTLTATDDLSGVDKIYYTTDRTIPTTGSPVYTGPITISASTTLYYRAIDLAGNMEAAKGRWYEIDTIAPTGSITINGGAAVAHSTSVILTLSASGAARMRFSDDGATWGDLAADDDAVQYTLPAGYGPKTVYVQFVDWAGNWSETASDSIILEPPCTYNVPSAEHPTIQSGIDAAIDGDTVAVAGGTYYENVRFEGKSITLTSSDPAHPEATVIDGNASGSVVSLCDPWEEGDPMPDAWPDTYPVIRGFTIRNGNAAYGAGISGGDPMTGMDQGGMYLTVNRCHIVGNTALEYGGGVCVSTERLTMTSCIISNNQTLNFLAWSGGVEAGHLTMTDCTVTQNRTACWGGGVSCATGVFDGCTIAGNYAGEGGGVYCSDSLTMSNSNVTGNDAQLGAGIEFSGSITGACTITNCTVSGNGHLPSGPGWYTWGGGICSNFALTLTNCTITNNSADFGGGLALGGPSVITNCTISGNAARVGGGIALERSANSRISNCIISGNTADGHEMGYEVGGAGLYCSGGEIITNCTIVGNGGVGVYLTAGWDEFPTTAPVVTNCIFWGNAGEIEVYPDTVSPVVTYCNVQGGYEGTGNINVDPQFIFAFSARSVQPGAFTGNYHLKPTSPCIDSGTDAGAAGTDRDGNPRLGGPGYDMGAYEHGTTSFEGNDAQYVSQSIPSSLSAGERATVAVTMRNNGTSPWTSEAGYKLGTQNPHDNTIWTVINRVHLAEGESVAPGQEKTFTFEIKAPSTPGTYNFQMRMVHESVEWFGDRSTNVVVSVRALQPNDARFISQSVPSSLAAGESATVSVTMKNNGTNTWTPTAGYGYKLGSENPLDNDIWGFGKRVYLAEGESVAPGQEKTFTFEITAPSTPGAYNVQMRMVHEGVAWFGDRSANVVVSVRGLQPNDARFISQSIPSSLAAGESATVSVTMRNTGTTTWTSEAGYRLGTQNQMPLQGFDEAYYLRAKLAALQATKAEWVGETITVLKTVLQNVYGLTSEAHYNQYGWKEGLTPNAYFNAAEYKLAKAQSLFNSGHYPTLQAAEDAFDAAWPADPYQHYLQYGSREGINPSNSFDESSYLASKLVSLKSNPATSAEWATKTVDDVRAAFAAAGFTALGHYLAYGITEGIAVTPVPPGEQVHVPTAQQTTGAPTTGLEIAAATSAAGDTLNTQDDKTWGFGGRVNLAPGESVVPGQEKTFTFEITAPSIPGAYNFQMRMVHEGVEWFGDFSANAVIAVQTNGITINGGATYTRSASVTLILSPTDPLDVTQMQFSNDGVSWGDPMAYASIASYTLPSTNGIKTVYARFKDAAGNWSAPVSDTIILDTVAPAVTNSYPEPGDKVIIPTQGNPLTLLMVYGDGVSGMHSVKLLNQEGEGITGQAQIEENTIELAIQNPVGAYRYTVVLEDMAGNKSSTNIDFTVDSTIPVTTASVKGGSFVAPLVVNLTCSEAATVYYSIDGYPPFVGAQNTIAAPAPVSGIAVDRTRRLQFFAVDTAGNIETTKSEFYLLGTIPEPVTGLSAVHNKALARVQLAWSTGAGSVAGYRVYRCINALDRAILDESREGGYAPPSRLRLASDLTGTSYNDSSAVPGASYCYGVTVIDANGNEGRISELVPVTINTTVSAQNKDDAIDRAVAWLESAQNELGYWGADEDTRMLATSQVLDAFWRKGMDDAGIRQARFYLRGRHADNNDYLARQIQTLKNFGENVDEKVNRLISQAYYWQTCVIGWAMQKRYVWDALDTVLGAAAVKYCGAESVRSQGNAGFGYLKDNEALWSIDSTSAVVKRYGWIAKGASSIYVSARVYQALNTYYGGTVYSHQWVLDLQRADGSFGNGLVDTAAVLLWLSPTDPGKSKAVDYLVSKQDISGSWNNDPYLTGLCLEALLK